jgi:putative ABC transport system permease protein
MALPLSYSLRNLWRRPWRTLLTVSGIAVVVFAAVLMASLARGVQTRVKVTGEPDNLLLISRKGENIVFSSIEADELNRLSSLPGVAAGPDGAALVSAEIMDMAPVAAEFNGRKHRSPMNVRGVQPVAYQVHKIVRVVDGRLPQQPSEVLVGCMSHVRLGVPVAALAVGRKVRLYNNDWTVCGRFSAGDTLVESEFWVDVAEQQAFLTRRTYTMAILKMESPEKAQAALALLSQAGSAFEKDFKGKPEPAYYAEFLASLSWIYWLTLFMAAAVTLAGLLIGVNTMYTAILNRIREIGAQRVLGFSRFDILRGLLLESLVMALLGGVLGAAAGLALNDYQFKFSQGVFRLVVDTHVLGAGVAQALLIGFVGALIPSWKGLRLPIVDALRSERGA